MPTIKEAGATAATEADETATTETKVERRRAGRIESVSPRLIPLLRRQSAEQNVLETSADIIEENQSLRPGVSPHTFRGLAIGILLAIPLWGAIALFVLWLMRTH